MAQNEAAENAHLSAERVYRTKDAFGKGFIETKQRMADFLADVEGLIE